MPVLLDLALAVLVLAGALFLGATAIALIKALYEDKNPNDKDQPKQ